MDVKEGIVPSEGIEPMPKIEVVVGVVDEDVWGALPSTPAFQRKI